MRLHLGLRIQNEYREALSEGFRMKSSRTALVPFCNRPFALQMSSRETSDSLPRPSLVNMDDAIGLSGNWKGRGGSVGLKILEERERDRGERIK